MVHLERGKEWNGFMTYRYIEPMDGNLIAVTTFQGQVEVWWVMNRNGAVENLQKYYRETRGREATFRIFQAI